MSSTNETIPVQFFEGPTAKTPDADTLFRFLQVLNTELVAMKQLPVGDCEKNLVYLAIETGVGPYDCACQIDTNRKHAMIKRGKLKG